LLIGRDEFQVITVDLRTFVLSGSQPIRITGLTVFFSQLHEVGATFNRIVDTVCQCLCFQRVFHVYLNLAEFDRVGTAALATILKELIVLSAPL